MIVIEEARAMTEWSMARPADEKPGLVPTMGALHEGHISLVRRAVDENDATVVSVFVNPRQFGPGEDLDRYPRDREGDIRILEAEGVDIAFFPAPDEIYPKGFSVEIDLPALTRTLCGPRRPGHFSGVATVVARLFGIVRPRRAYFGWKDAQQFVILRRMVEDLALGIEMVGCETVREADGLAFSSRNAYLSGEERRRAPAIYRALLAGRDLVLKGKSGQEVIGGVRDLMAEAGIEPEYIEAVREDDLSPATPGDERIILAAAARLGETRLIDNVRILAWPRRSAGDAPA